VKTISDVLQLSTAFLLERKVERARRRAEELLAGALEVKRMDLYLQFDRPLVEKELSPMRDWLKRCAQGEPIEYILGKVEFAGCQISIDRRVLIPRQETEILVDHISKRIGQGVLWDLCTGSGCIGISLKKKWPQLSVTLSDLSADALAVASRNAEANGVEVELVQGDLLAPFLGKKADVIVCNPPYISANEYLHLQPSVRDFEPKGALVGGERGTEYYERLAVDLPGCLHSGGLVFLEIGSGQGEVLKKNFSLGPWSRMEVEKDWSGLDRFFFLEKQ